jgi:hypothetical protein
VGQQAVHGTDVVGVVRSVHRLGAGEVRVLQHSPAGVLMYVHVGIADVSDSLPGPPAGEYNVLQNCNTAGARTCVLPEAP